MSPAEKSKKGWLLLALATAVFFIGAGIYFLFITVGESKRIEQTLIDRHGWASRYTPPMDGIVPADRLERFIRVREAVQPNCIILQRILFDILSLEAIEESEDLSAGEKVSESLGSFKSMFSFAPNFLEFMDARNLALLADEMSIGEYIYIYLAAYGEQLDKDSDSEYADREETRISPRARKEFAQMLINQTAAIEAAGQEQSLAKLHAELQTEIDGLKSGSHSSPWPNGPPENTQRALAPYRNQLTDLYCSGIVKTELMQKNRGLNFEG